MSPTSSDDHHHQPRRKLVRSSNQLKRNAACLPCRRRRIKCDAAKPHCASCIRSFQFLSRTHPDRERDSKGVICFYDEEEEEEMMHGRSGGNGVGYGDEDGNGIEHGNGNGNVQESRETQETGLKKRKSSGPGGSLTGSVEKRGSRDYSEGKGDTKEAIKKLEARVSELQRALESNHTPPNGMLGIQDVALASTSTSTSTSNESWYRPSAPLNELDGRLQAPELPGTGAWGYPQGAVPSSINSGPSVQSYKGAPSYNDPAGSNPDTMSQNLDPSLSTIYAPQARPQPQPEQQQQQQPYQIWTNSVPTAYDPVTGRNNSNHSSSFGQDVNGQTGTNRTSFSASVVEDVGGLGSGIMGGGQLDLGGIDAEAGKLSGDYLELFWPGWPPRLPTPAMMDHLVETFFTMVPSLSRLLHRSSLTARLALPPSHADFPHVALLHAICAVTGRFSAAVYTDPVEQVMQRANQDMAGMNIRKPGTNIEDEIAGIACFSERNARYAMVEARPHEARGQRLFEVMQALAIMVNYYQQNARWTEGWMATGICARGIIPLGLSHDTKVQAGKSAIRISILPAPANDREREERRILMYYIMGIDAIASASSGWSNSVQYDELSASLPCGIEDFERGHDIPHNPQKFHSPDLFSNHPVVDSHVMLVKGIILLARITKFVRKWRALEDVQNESGRDLPEFKKLDSDIATFRMTFPPSLRDILQPRKGASSGIDADLISAHLVPHVASILLHEPFADLTNANCPSARRLLTEARACLNISYVVTSTSMDIRYMLQTISSCNYFFTAARTLLLFYQRALDVQDAASANLFMNEVRVFKNLFATYGTRFAMGARHSMMLDSMMTSCEEDTKNYGHQTELPTIFNRMWSSLPTTFAQQPNTLLGPNLNGPQARAFERQVSQIFDPETSPSELDGLASFLHPDAILYSGYKKIKEIGDLSFGNLMDVRRGFVGYDKSIEYPRLVSDGGAGPAGMGLLKDDFRKSGGQEFRGGLLNGIGNGEENKYGNENAKLNGVRGEGLMNTLVGGDGVDQAENWWFGSMTANVTLLSPESGQTGSGSSSGPPT